MSEVDIFLAHHGVKGMKWGVRRSRGVTRTKVRATTAPGRKVTTTGGQGQKPSADAVRAAVYKQKAKASTTDSLSNKQLKELLNRMQMEQQYNQLRPKSNSEKARQFVSSLLLNNGKQHANKVANDFVTKKVAGAFK